MASRVTRSRRLQQSSTADSTNSGSMETHTDSHSFRSRDESHAYSKFVEAMKNPNWRRRGHTESESTSAEPLCSQAALENLKSGHDKGTDSSDDMESWEFVDMEPLGPSYRQGRKSTSRKSPTRGPDGRKNPGKIQPLGYCQLLAYKELTDAWPHSLIEVRPLAGPLAGGCHTAMDLVEVRRVAGDCLNQTGLGSNPGKDEQSEQFAAALEAVDKTPQKVKLPTQHLAHQQSVTAIPKTTSMRDKHKESILKDLASTDIARLPNDVDAAKSRSSVSNTPYDEVPRPRKTAVDDTAAYQRFLEKLCDKQRRCPIARESGSVPEESGWPRNMEEHRGKMVVGGGPGEAGDPSAPRQRDDQNRSSDSGYHSLQPKCNDENAGPNPKASKGSFNPRAREFLSFAGKQRAPGDGDNYQKLRRVPIEDLFSKTGTSRRLESPGADSTPALYELVSGDMPINSGPFVPSLEPGAPYNVSNPCFNLNVLPNNFGCSPATWSPGQFPNFAFPPLPTPMVNSWMSGAPTSLTNAGIIPLQGPGLVSPSGLVTKIGVTPPSAPQFGGNPPSTGPGPVPKPRKPDPKDQQAYEAWIEWRKANEPGYAMECKLRQQRRSRRNGTTSTINSRSDSGSKSEVAAAA